MADLRFTNKKELRKKKKSKKESERKEIHSVEGWAGHRKFDNRNTLMGGKDSNEKKKALGKRSKGRLQARQTKQNAEENKGGNRWRKKKRENIRQGDIRPIFNQLQSKRKGYCKSH